MDLITSIPGIGPYLPWITLAIALASLLASAMPAPASASGVYYAIYQVVNTIAANFGHGKNLSAPESKGVVGGPGAVSNPQIATGSAPKPS